MVNFTYANGYTVPGIPYNGTIQPAYYLPNGTLWPAGLYSNGSMILAQDCNATICSLENANQLYVPKLGENVALAAIFGLLLLLHLPLGIFYRTWGFSVGAVLGLVLEVVGYIGRIMMHDNIFTQGPFIIYICCLTIAPAFLSAAIYLCLARIITVYGQHLARFRPFVYTVVFMISDFFSLVLQGAGGGLASTGDTPDQVNTGVNVMIAGLAFQVVSLVIFIVLCSDFAIRVWRHKHDHNPEFASLRNGLKFKLFLVALSTATIMIFIRSIYRVAELKAGFHSSFANNETTFLVLEGIMVTIASIAITAFHPGFIYGRANWAAANFKMRSKGDMAGAKENPSLSSTELHTYERQN
ncbi:MAG: hypothetical protein MMC23_008345 [Stictis urceolatum]|nr:hypothetical protein [Stictis urceolata]